MTSRRSEGSDFDDRSVLPSPSFPTLDILDYGAAANGVRDDTDAFERAIQIIEDHGGGRLRVGPGFYNIRPINMTSNMELYVTAGATIRGIADNTVWPVIPGLPSYGQGRDHMHPMGPRHTSLLHGENLTNITVRGEDVRTSIIDGNGPYWYKLHHSGKEVITRGSLVQFMYSSQVRIYNIRLKDSPFWTVHIYDCDDVHIRECHIEAPIHSYNTDGWDPDSSRNVLIEDSTYIGGDDCVAIKSGWDCLGIDYGKPSVNITLRNLTCSGSFAGGIALGSEMSGGIENVLGEFLHFPAYVNKPINIKTSNTRGGYVRNVTFRDIDVTGILQQPAIFVDMFKYTNNRSQNPNCPANWTPPALPIFEDLFFYRFNGMTAVFEGNETYHIMAFDQSPVINMVMEDIYFPSPSEEQHGVEWQCSAVKGTIKNHTVSPWPPCAGFEIVEDGDVSPIGIEVNSKQAFLLRSYMELYGTGDCFFAWSISCCAAAVLLAVVLAYRSRTWNRKG